MRVGEAIQRAPQMVGVPSSIFTSVASTRVRIMRHRIFLGVSFVVGVSCLFLGCAGSKDDGPRVNARGRLLDKGKPYVFDEAKVKLPPGTSAPPVAESGGGGGVQIAFISVEGSDTSYARLDPNTGTFEVQGLKPGRYKIALTVSNALPGATDPFGGKFTPEKTKIIRDIKGGEDIEIDISKPTG